MIFFGKLLPPCVLPLTSHPGNKWAISQPLCVPVSTLPQTVSASSCAQYERGAWGTQPKTGAVTRASLTLRMLNHTLLITGMVSFLYPTSVVVLLLWPTYKWTFCNRRPKNSEHMWASKNLASLDQSQLSFLCESFSSLIVCSKQFICFKIYSHFFTLNFKFIL